MRIGPKKYATTAAAAVVAVTGLMATAGTAHADGPQNIRGTQPGNADLSHVRGAVSVRRSLTVPRPATIQPPSQTHRSDSEILLEY